VHELSICQSLLSQVESLAKRHQASQVARIVVQIGPLCGVVPELLEHAFTIARANTVAAQAELVLQKTTVRIRCQTCGAEMEANPNQLLCNQCGDWQIQLLSGDEIFLMQIELVTP
jgi:hydrogenase nickel incorporation protein HypA/HybF